MTARQVWEAMLIETSKINAPSLLLEEFNYYFNKAINNYINKRYNIYDINQQTSDDVRVLKSTAILRPKEAYADYEYNERGGLQSNLSVLANLQGATYEVELPMDYLHLLNCICIYKVKKNFKCYNGNTYVLFPATRLTSDSWSTIINDYYNRPTYKKPYYYLHNVNTTESGNTANIYTGTDANGNKTSENIRTGNFTESTIPTNPREFEKDGYTTGTDMVGVYDKKIVLNSSDTEDGYSLSDNEGSNFSRVISLGDNSNINVSTVEKATAHRYGNASRVRMEIRYGKDNTIFELVEVQVDYIKTPLFIRLTTEQVDAVEDYSLIMEFPDYVCQEIINELTMLVMSRMGDPTISTFALIKETIANPAQALSAPQS